MGRKGMERASCRSFLHLEDQSMQIGVVVRVVEGERVNERVDRGK